MKLPLKWLADYVNIGNPDIKDYCEKMTATGSKVEGFEILGEDISNVVVGKINAISKHPNADKLVVCSIDTGESEPLQIVTGAKNVKDIMAFSLLNEALLGTNASPLKKVLLEKELAEDIEDESNDEYGNRLCRDIDNTNKKE